GRRRGAGGEEALYDLELHVRPRRGRHADAAGHLRLHLVRSPGPWGRAHRHFEVDGVTDVVGELPDVEGEAVGALRGVVRDADADVPRDGGAGGEGSRAEAECPIGGAGRVEPEVERGRGVVVVRHRHGERDDLARGGVRVVERRREVLLAYRGAYRAGDVDDGPDERRGIARSAVTDAHHPGPGGVLTGVLGEAGAGAAVRARRVVAPVVVFADDLEGEEGVPHRLGVVREPITERDGERPRDVGGVAAAAGAVVGGGEAGPAQRREHLAGGGDHLDGEVADPLLVD